MNSQRSRVQRLLIGAAGFVLICAPFFGDVVLSGQGTPLVLTSTFILTGCTLLTVALVVRPGRTRAALAKGSVAVLSVAFALGLAEITFRIIGFNFDAPSRRTPIFVLRPSFHDGHGILRRAGPISWRGKPLSYVVRNYVGGEAAYSNERTIEIHYDRLGFRNPPELTDWEVVVTGDSFVESGYLSYDEIFTTLTAKRLGIRIKNLGVSGTGPIFQTAYTKKYGKALSTKHAVLCFFDGNDVTDLCREVSVTNYICRTGHAIGGAKQVSLIIALQERLRGLLTQTEAHVAPGLPNAVLTVAGEKYPATISSVLPPSWKNLRTNEQNLITAALAEWGRTTRSLGMQPWVMCIPERQRVLHGYLHSVGSNDVLATWQPNQFGPHLAKICEALGIHFIDAFPSLRREMEAGRVPYNLFGDGHLSVQGSRVVAEVLADALRTDVQEQQHQSAGP